MGGDRVPSLNLDEPVSMRKLRIFYMEGISDVPLIQPLSTDMRATLRKVSPAELVIFELRELVQCSPLSGCGVL